MACMGASQIVKALVDQSKVLGLTSRAFYNGEGRMQSDGYQVEVPGRKPASLNGW